MYVRTIVAVMKVLHMVIVYIYCGYYVKCGDLRQTIIIRKRHDKAETEAS